MITIHNLRQERPQGPTDMAVDRKHPVLGNHIGKGLPTREEQIQAFQRWLEACLELRDPAVRDSMNSLYRTWRRYGRLRLFCWCAPEACHADVIKGKLEQAARERGLLD